LELTEITWNDRDQLNGRQWKTGMTDIIQKEDIGRKALPSRRHWKEGFAIKKTLALPCKTRMTDSIQMDNMETGFAGEQFPQKEKGFAGEQYPQKEKGFAEEQYPQKEKAPPRNRKTCRSMRDGFQRKHPLFKYFP
jgi:hypothetical protein